MSHLLQPLKAGKLSLKNRLVMPPIATSKAENDGTVSQALLNYYNEKSAGGHIGLIVIEHSYVHLTGKASNNQLSVSKDADVAGLSKLAAVIHANGSKAVMQINHAGSASAEEVTGSTPLAPSAVANPRKGGALPRELSRKEVAGLVQAFGDAARRVKSAGFDGVEIHSAHGYLLSQFFSPLTNKRTDEYGGGVQNRIRLHLDVIAAVRHSVGPDFPVMLRLGASDFTEGGITIEDSQFAAAAFAQAGVSILDISGSFTGYQMPGASGQGYFAPLTAAIKEVVHIPVILTGGITEAASAEQLLADGKADLIGVGRAIFLDSTWAKQAVEGLIQHQ